jgi:hypothetical protein
MSGPGQAPRAAPGADATNEEFRRAERIGDPPGFIAEETPAMDATAAAWRAHLEWLRSLPAEVELRAQRIAEAEAKLRELEGRPLAEADPAPYRP